MIKSVRNLIIGITALLMCFYIGGSFLIIVMSIALGHSISRLVDFLLPIKETDNENKQ